MVKAKGVGAMNNTISLIIDDPMPHHHFYYLQYPDRVTAKGEPIVSAVPHAFLEAFCECIERYDIRGKFSVVPCPKGLGSVADSIDGVEPAVLAQWLNTVKTRVAPRFSLCPEMLTHAGAMELTTGVMTDENEAVWSNRQDRTALTPYIAKALALLREAGLFPTGVTSPWNFGEQVEDEYTVAIAEALATVCGRRDGWYFCRYFSHEPNVQPWVALDENGRRLVSIPGTVEDYFWQTILSGECSEAYVADLADHFITADGTAGDILEAVRQGTMPVLLTHWQALFSNGTWAGLRVLEEVARRVRKHTALHWRSFDEIMQRVLTNREFYDKVITN